LLVSGRTPSTKRCFLLPRVLCGLPSRGRPLLVEEGVLRTGELSAEPIDESIVGGLLAGRDSTADCLVPRVLRGLPLPRLSGLVRWVPGGVSGYRRMAFVGTGIGVAIVIVFGLRWLLVINW